MSDLYTTPERDGFRTESPIRAFTDWNVSGNYAIGKGFRPSLQHLPAYLDAMQSKEGWSLLQILEADEKVPTLVFSRHSPPLVMVNPAEVTSERRVLGKVPELGMPYTPGHWGDGNTPDNVEVIYDESGMSAGAGAGPLLKPDPINPKHYNGRACADIGERLSANGYQVLKYCWRLGKKDDPCQELGKALWYLDSEIQLLERILGSYRKGPIRPMVWGLEDNGKWFLADRLHGQPEFTQTVARVLWGGYNLEILRGLEARILQEKTYLECGHGLAV